VQFLKNMKTEIIIKVALNLCVFMISMILCYLAVAFFTLHLDFRLWTEGVRGTYLYVGICISSFTTSCINFLD